VQSAASLNGAAPDASWRISREGAVVAVVDMRHEGGSVVVSAGPVTASKPHSFGSLQAADAFTADLLTSFAYLGCEVVKS
jgi:hypothetical protein